MNIFKSNGGFTLVELIVVIAILAILAGVAVPVYSSYIASANDSVVENTLENLYTSAVLANAKCGGITKITVTSAGAVTIVADSFDTNFPTTLANTMTVLSNVKLADDGKSVTASWTIKEWASSSYKGQTATWASNAWTYEADKTTE